VNDVNCGDVNCGDGNGAKGGGLVNVNGSKWNEDGADDEGPKLKVMEEVDPGTEWTLLMSGDHPIFIGE